MSMATLVLFGIKDEFEVVSVERLDPDQVQIIIEMRLADAPCPACGVFTSRVKDRLVRRVRDLPASGQQTKL
jgi:transposase